MTRKLSVAVLVLLAGLSAWFIVGLFDVRFDYDFEKFFPQDDPETQFFNEYRALFDSDNDFILIGIEKEDGIFHAPFLSEVARLTDSLKAMRYVQMVNSPTNAQQLIFDPLLGTPIQKPWLRYDQPEHYSRDSARVYQQPELYGTLFSPSRNAVCIFVKTDNYISKETADTLSVDLNRVMSQFDFEEVHITGRAPGQAYYVELLQHEFVLFISISLILITLFLIVAFRSFWGVWVPLLVVLLAVIWTVGLLARLDHPLGIMLNVLPVIVFVVGVSDVVHLVTRYFEELRKEQPKMKALITAFKEVGLATFLTSVTTGIGFLTLMTSNIEPIREFGMYTAIGIFLAFILAYTLLPAVLVLSSRPKAVDHPTNKLFWEKRLRNLFRWVLRRRIAVLVGSSMVFLLSLLGAMQIESNNYLLEDLRDSDPLKQQFFFMEEHFGGVRPFELYVEVTDPHKTVYDMEVLREIEKLNHYLDTGYLVGAQISVAHVVKSLNQAANSGRRAQYELPETERQLQSLLRKLKAAEKMGTLSAIVDESGKKTRIAGRIADEGNIAVTAKNEKLMAFIDESIDPELLRFRLTGTSMLIDLNNEALSTNMIYGLLIAFGVIALIMGLLYRSLKMVILTLIPNMLPVLMIAGIMGWTGIPLKVSTSIIFTIAFGIAVDDTIHFMSKLKLELLKGRSMIYAIKRTFLSTGKAIVVTSIILCGGFITLIGSGFLGTYYIGLLISMMLLFAVLADLLLLPALLVFFYPEYVQVKSVRK